MSELTVRKVGVKFHPAAIVMTYREGASGSTRRRTIPVRNISKNSSIEDLAAEMKSVKNHQKWDFHRNSYRIQLYSIPLFQ